MLRRRRALIGITTFAVLAIAILASAVETPTYRATAEIVFQDSAATTVTAPVQSLDPTDVQTQIEVMNGAQVRKLVAASLRTTTAPKVSAVPVLNTNAIQVTATSTDPVEAAKVANAYANAYIGFRQDQTQNDLLDAEQLIEGRIAGLQTQITALDAQINGASASVQANLGPQRDSLVSEQATLQEQLDQSRLQAGLGNTGAELDSPASAPTSPSSPHPLSNAISGLVLGLVAGVALAYLVEFLDDSVKSKEDAEKAAHGVSTLAVVPAVAGWKQRSEAMIVSNRDPSAPASEAYRALRTSVQFSALDRSVRVLQVTSPTEGEGKTTTIVNLAVALGHGNLRVCLVDCDLRRPRVHEFFGLSNDRGFTSVLSGDLPLSAALQVVPGSDNITVLTAGTPPFDPADLLASGRAKGVLASLERQFDIVLVDSPPILPVTDAAVLSRATEAVVIVVEAGRTKKRALTRAIELLRQVDGPVLGLVINRAGADTSYGYSYASKYYRRTAPVVEPLRRGRSRIATWKSSSQEASRQRESPGPSRPAPKPDQKAPV